MNSKNYNKSNRKFIQGLRSFKDILPSNVKKLINKKGQVYSETLDNWRYFVGKNLFDISFPKSFKNENKLGSSCLTVMVKRGNEVNFEYSKNLIIEKINSFFGYDAIQNIKLVTFEEKNEEFSSKSLDNNYANESSSTINGEDLEQTEAPLVSSANSEFESNIDEQVSENNGLENFELSDDDTPELFNSNANEELSISPKEINSEEEEDLEIPAFLRRQKN